MKQTMNQITDRLRLALKVCDVIAASVKEVNPVIFGLRERLERIWLQCAEPAGSLQDEAQAGKLREQLAAVRPEIRECNLELERLKAKNAEAYRSVLGNEKDAFEQMPDAEQEWANAPAYELKQNFHRIARLEELLRLISADMMNAGGEIEHQILKTKHTPGIGPVKPIDNVPAPPTLSP